MLGERVLYFDTDSVIFSCPCIKDTGIPIDTTGALGWWTSEAPGDFFTDFVSSGPKSYALKSHSGKNDVCKSKGFYLHHSNKQIFNFESIKTQVLAKAFDLPVDHLVLHQNEMIMRRHFFDIVCSINKGKEIKMIYDKRKIVPPGENEGWDTVKIIDTVPHGFEV